MCEVRHEGKILGCSRDPPTNMGALSEGTITEHPRDPPDSMGDLCLRGHEGRVPDVPASMGAYVRKDIQGRSRDILKMSEESKTVVSNTEHDKFGKTIMCVYFNSSFI